MAVNKKQVFSSFFWKFAERIAAQMVTFVVSIVLARLLRPEDYGEIALITVFITIANVFVSDSFSSALIQNVDADDEAFSTVFYFNIFTSFLLYGIIYLIAPLVASFYDMPVLSPALRVLAMQIPIAAVKSVQQAYVSKTMQFKRFFFSTIGGTLFSAVVGIVMAYKGFGIWALVFQYLTNSVVDTLVLWFTVKWRPIKKFSKNWLKKLFRYGSGILVASLIYNIYTQIRSLMIGKIYSTEDLAYYSKGSSLPGLIITNLVVSISSVLFPAISSAQDDLNQVKQITRKSIRCCSFILSPLLLGLFGIAEPLIVLLMKEKWLPCVPYLRIACVSVLMQPLQTANQEALKGIGRSDIYLKLELIKRPIGFFLLFISIQYGVLAVALVDILQGVISYIINAFPSNKQLNYSYWEQIKDIMPNIFRALIMLVCVFAVIQLPIGALGQVIVGVAVGAVVYIGLAWITKSEDYTYLLNTIKSFGRKKDVE